MGNVFFFLFFFFKNFYIKLKSLRRLIGSILINNINWTVVHLLVLWNTNNFKELRYTTTFCASFLSSLVKH